MYIYSLENPHAYIETNIQGFLNVLECSRIFNIKNLVYASSSSVYGENKSYPFSTKDEVKNQSQFMQFLNYPMS